MRLRLERHAWNGRGIDIDQADRRMARHDMAAAARAELPVAERGLAEPAERLRTLGHLDVLGLPDGEGVHRRCRIGPAGAAVAVTHGHRRAGDLDLHRPAEATPGVLVGHVRSSHWMGIAKLSISRVLPSRAAAKARS